MAQWPLSQRRDHPPDQVTMWLQLLLTATTKTSSDETNAGVVHGYAHQQHLNYVCGSLGGWSWTVQNSLHSILHVVMGTGMLSAPPAYDPRPF